jgi:hypothetical protein
MTAQELMTLLSTLPPDTPVMMSGYEAGYTDVLRIDTFPVKLNVNTQWYYGPHEICEDGYRDCTPDVTAAILS